MQISHLTETKENEVGVNPGLGTDRPASEHLDQSTVEGRHSAVNTTSTQPVAKA
jgi:hypothetical protein